MRMMRFGLVFGVALLVSACFDLEQSVRIDRSGAGSVELSMTTDRLVDGDMAFESILKSEDGAPDIRKFVADGKFHYQEALTFKSLNALSLKDETMSVTVGKPSYWGFGPARATFKRKIDVGGAKASLPPIIGSVFEGHTYTFTAVLPGWVAEAKPITINGQEIKPVRKNAKVTWTIPMNLFMSADSLTFEASFSGFLKMKDGAQSDGS